MRSAANICFEHIYLLFYEAVSMFQKVQTLFFICKESWQSQIELIIVIYKDEMPSLRLKQKRKQIENMTKSIYMSLIQVLF